MAEITARGAARKMLRVARLADADPRVASLAGVLHDALAAEGTPAAARAVSQLRLFLGNGLASRVVPSVNSAHHSGILSDWVLVWVYFKFSRMLPRDIL